MYKICLSALLLLFCSFLQAQITMTLQVPPTGTLLKKQLWNMVLLNSSAGSKEVKLSLVLTDATAQQPVLTAVTQPFILLAGAKQVTAEDIIIQYDYALPSAVPDQDANGFLAVGNYEACYTLEETATAHTEPTSQQDCINFTVEPLSPPMLLLPQDEAMLDAVTQFAWLPPAPLNIFSDLNYDCIVVEVQNGQTSAEAIQQNIPLIHNNGQDLFLNPALAPSFDTGKLYAWQVVAKNGSSYAAMSDVWTFKIKGDSALVMPPVHNDYISFNAAQGIQALQSDTIGLKYQSELTDTATIRFYDSNNEVVYQYNTPLTYGDNFIIIKLPSFFKKEEVYAAEIADTNKTSYKIFFTVQ